MTTRWGGRRHGALGCSEKFGGVAQLTAVRLALLDSLDLKSKWYYRFCNPTTSHILLELV